MLPNETQPLISDRSTTRPQKGPKPKAGPRFVFVNGRTPRGHAHCAACCEPIGDAYVRDVQTGLLYCDRSCSTGHSQRISGLASQLRAWIVS
jgi:hypothetical protein